MRNGDAYVHELVKVGPFAYLSDLRDSCPQFPELELFVTIRPGNHWSLGVYPLGGMKSEFQFFYSHGKTWTETVDAVHEYVSRVVNPAEAGAVEYASWAEVRS